MAKKTSLIGKAIRGMKAAATGDRARQPSGASEKIVTIPEIAVFSELPFARVAVIGGTGVNIVTNPSTPRRAARKAVSKTNSASSKAGRTTKKSAVKKTSKRKKVR